MGRVAVFTLCLTGVACTFRAAAPVGPIPVAIIAEPPRAVPLCWMPEIPHAPALSDIDFDEPDVMRRSMVHRLEWAEMVQWAMEMQTWAEEAKRCMDALKGIE